MWGAVRKRSTSEGEGDRLSSILNLLEATTFNRFNNLNADRCASTPQINISGFIDDNFESSRGALNQGFALDPEGGLILSM